MTQKVPFKRISSSLLPLIEFIGKNEWLLSRSRCLQGNLVSFTVSVHSKRTPPILALNSGNTRGHPGPHSFSKECSLLDSVYSWKTEDIGECLFSNTVSFSSGVLLFAYQLLLLATGGICVPGIFLDCFTGREAYFNLQQSERNMKELKESYKGGVGGLQVSEKDLTVALGR